MYRYIHNFISISIGHKKRFSASNTLYLFLAYKWISATISFCISVLLLRFVYYLNWHVDARNNSDACPLSSSAYYSNYSKTIHFVRCFCYLKNAVPVPGSTGIVLKAAVAHDVWYLVNQQLMDNPFKLIRNIAFKLASHCIYAECF